MGFLSSISSVGSPLQNSGYISSLLQAAERSSPKAHVVAKRKGDGISAVEYQRESLSATQARSWLEKSSESHESPPRHRSSRSCCRVESCSRKNHSTKRNTSTLFNQPYHLETRYRNVRLREDDFHSFQTPTQISPSSKTPFPTTRPSRMQETRTVRRYP